MLGVLPNPGSLDHLQTLNAGGKKAPPAGLSIGAGLPPVPQKLVAKIQSGEFVDMAELLPDRMGLSAARNDLATDEKEGKQGSKSKRRQVTNILEWVQCFSIYMAVVSEKHPDRIKDLLGYQALIVEARMEYDSETWLGYDRRFRQTVAATPDAVWARIDPTLWNMAFTGQARAQRCKFCFSLTHQSHDCDWAPMPHTVPPSASNTQRGNVGPTQKANNRRPNTQICYSWNHTPDPKCIFPDCKYNHVCLHCARDPQITDIHHKAIHCSRRRYPQARPSANPSGHSYRYQPY